MSPFPPSERPDTEPRPPKTTQAYWDSGYRGLGAVRPSSRFSVGTANLRRLLQPHVRPGIRFLELGCAPGRMLAWAASRGAQVTGLDYSERGLASTRALMDSLQIAADLRCEDVFSHSLPREAFDVVYSCGLIEHFDDPTEIVRQHTDLLAPDGTAIIAIPNYGGIFGRLQGRIHPENLAIHNLRIMSPGALRALSPPDGRFESAAFPFGRLSPGLISWDELFPRSLARLTFLALNVAGMMQPFAIDALAPHLVLRVLRVS